MATGSLSVPVPDPRLARAVAEYERRTPRSAAIWKEARRRTPLGVHSNYRYYEPYPFYVERAQGVRLWDADGNAYLDFNLGFGALASGHAHPRIVEAVSQQAAQGTLYGYEWHRTPELIDRLLRRYDLDQARLSSTGLEASHHAVRISRGVTGHRYVLKIEGGYHGSHDSLLIGVKPPADRAGPADRPRSVPAGPGILPEVADRTRVCPFNDLEAVRAIARDVASDVAAIVVEPIPMNMGLVLPEPGFLAGLRELADELGALLWFDEIKTGAKYPHGAAGRFGVRPDGMLLGKSIASGLPLSVIATRAGLLDGVGPGRIAHAGTFNANPLSVAAALATLEHILTEEYFERSARLNRRLSEGYRSILSEARVPSIVSSDGPSGTVYFSEHPVRDWRSFLRTDGNRSMLYFFLGLNRGLIPSGTGADEQWTISTLHTEADIDRHLEVLGEIAPTLSAPVAPGGIEESV